MTNIPLVTVVMPVYNAEKYLKEAVESILNQTFSDFEFLIIDDGSTDDSWNILNSYSDDRIRLVRNPSNLKLIITLNHGLALARGKYIARMDADDISLPERFEKQVKFLEGHSNVGVLGTSIEIVDQSRNWLTKIQFPLEPNVARWLLHFGCPVAHPSVMMRRALIDQIGDYNIEMSHAEDYDLWRRASANTQIKNLQEVLLLYRSHVLGVSAQYSSQQRENGIKISQLIMSETLGEEVPLGSVWLIWNRNLTTSVQVYQAAQLIYKLWWATNRRPGLSSTERLLIRQDSARRISDLASQRFWDPNVWQILGWGFYLDPSLLGRVAKKRVFRKTSNLFQTLKYQLYSKIS